MKLVLLVLFISVLKGDRLDFERQSCSTPKTVYTKTGEYWWTTPRRLVIHFAFSDEYWQKLTEFECHHKRSIRETTENPEDRNKTNLADPLLEKLEEWWGKYNYFREFFFEEEEKVMNSTIPLEVSNALMMSEKSPFSIGCKNNEINANIKIMSLETVIATKCEDVGEETKLFGSYLYYNISSSWMWESGNQTYHIQEEFCDEISDILLCSKEAIKQDPVCSIYNIELCEKISLEQDPQSPSTAFVRQLPGGVSVFGTFEEQTNYNEGSENHPERMHLDWGLYYFNYTEDGN